MVDSKKKKRKNQTEKTEFKKKKKFSFIVMWGINGDLISKVKFDSKINCVSFSNYIQGYIPNIIAAGTSSGEVVFFSSWDLTLLERIKVGNHSPVSTITFSDDCSQIFVGSNNGEINSLHLGF